MEILSFDFMQRAYLSGLLLGMMCPLVGVVLVLRRLSLTADTLAHISLAGVTLGALLGIYPIWTSLLFALLGVLAMEMLIRSYRTYAEMSIAILMAGGLGLSVVFIGLMKGSSVNVLGYLFGSLVAVGPTDLWVMGALLVVTVVYLLKWGRALLLIAFDDEMAKIQGIPVTAIQISFSIVVALLVSAAIRIVGVLLVSSLIVLPVAIALQLAKSYKATFWIAIVAAQLALSMGLTVSYYGNLAPGGSVVLLLVGGLICILTYRKWVRSWIGKRNHQMDLSEKT